MKQHVACMAAFAIVMMTVAASALADCSTSCSGPHGGCNHSADCALDELCSCSSHCGPTGVSCSCVCFKLSLAPGPIRDIDGPKIPIDEEGTELSFASDVDVDIVGVMINTLGWGAVIEGDGDASVDAGTYVGTLEGIVDEIGLDTGFTADWDETEGVVTLTVE